jgi:hypothetical protein
MNIVRKHGKPELFITTFTCNTSWPEIRRELLYNQTASDRPVLCSRVFNLKLKSLLKNLKKNYVLGKVMTIEFQKRGLPHAHILLILAPEDKFNSTDDVDAVISAELPDKETNPMLYQTISRDMLHGPCGPTFKGTRRMEDGKCKKRFPKKFSNVTKLAEGPSGGYPEYTVEEMTVMS